MKSPKIPETSKTMPYGSWGTFVTTLDHFAAVGIPNVIDRNTLPTSLSGAARYETLGAYRYFDIIGPDNRPNTALLKQLVDPETRKEAMVEALKRSYSGLFGMPLSTAGPTEVNNWFAKNTNSSTAQRAKAFFIRAAKANGVQLHSLVAKGTRVASGSIKRRPKKKITRQENAQDHEQYENGIVRNAANIIDKLLAKFPEFDPAWDAKVQEKWFEAFARLQEQVKN
jgi:hypothetical protein